MLCSARIVSTSCRRLLLSYPTSAVLGRQQDRLLVGHLSLIPKRLLSSVSEKNHSVVDENQESVVKKGIGFRQLWDKYGYISIGFYVSLYVTTLSSIFVSLDFDLLQASNFGFDPIESVKKVCDTVEHVTGSTKLPGFIRENPRVGTFAIAWIMTKFTEPIRFAITLAVVPSIARMFGGGSPSSPSVTTKTASTTNNNELKN